MGGRVGPIFSPTGLQTPTPIGGGPTMGFIPVRNLRKSRLIQIAITGDVATAAALAGWSREYRRAVNAEAHKIEAEMMKAMKQIIAKGEGKTTKFKNVAGPGKVKGDPPGVYGARRKRNVYSMRKKPFASSGRLITYFRAKVRAEKGFTREQVNVRMTFDVPNPKHRRIVAAIVKGSFRKVEGINVSTAIWYATGGKNGGTFYPPGAVLITPPRDIMKAAAEDASTAVKKRIEDAVARANVMTVAKIPPISMAKKTAETLLKGNVVRK